MNTTSVAARNVDDLWDKVHQEGYKAQPGEFEILHDAVGAIAMAVCCPGCGMVSLLPLMPGNGPSWKLENTSPTHPTLTPSIHHLGCWHGWLKDGRFESC